MKTIHTQLEILYVLINVSISIHYKDQENIFVLIMTISIIIPLTTFLYFKIIFAIIKFHIPILLMLMFKVIPLIMILLYFHVSRYFSIILNRIVLINHYFLRSEY